MQSYQQQFIELAIACDALGFGEFTLKSGRISPYFFNAGKMSGGAALATLGRCYASAILAAGIEFDMLFGPAYKGIPLTTATAVAMATEHGRDLPCAFNRKEVKDHGEGGDLMGSPVAGRVLIIDDVITAGTAVREVISRIEAAGARPVGVVVGLDRRERGRGELSAIEELERDFGLAVTSIVALDDVLEYLRRRGDDRSLIARIEAYRAQYGTGGAA